MAIAFDASSSANAGTASSLTFAHTCTGSDRVLIVGGGSIRAHFGGASVPITGITYAGVALTKIHDIKQAISGDIDVHGSLWYLVAPATGENDIIITFPVSQSDVCGIGVSYTGVDQVTPIGTGVEAAGATDPSSITLSSATGEVCVDFLSVAQPTITVNDGSTSRHEVENITFEAANGMSDEAGAASVVMGWAFGAGGFGDYWVQIGVPLKPVSGGAISGSMSLSVSGTGSLTGSGSLSGSTTVTVSGTAAMAGSASLAGVGSIVVSAVGTLIAGGSCFGVAGLMFSMSGTLIAFGTALVTDLSGMLDIHDPDYLVADYAESGTVSDNVDGSTVSELVVW